MPLLPAVVPLVTEKRSELVPARLARKVAPLFGVPSELNPFGQITWLCDFNKITLSEIARGAPSPTRAELAELRGVEPTRPWFFHHRAVVPGTEATLPNEIVNATMNRYGPHTKSAVLLTAANALFDPIVHAMRSALPLLASAQDETAQDETVHPVHAVTGWATVVAEVFRSQPALAIAACKARDIQRILLTNPEYPVAPGLADTRFARSEFGGHGEQSRPNPATQPRDLPLVDSTLDHDVLRGEGFATDGRLSREVDELGIGGSDLRPAIVDRLLEMLIDAMKPAGIGYVWQTEPVPGQVVMEALLPSDTLVDALLSWVAATHRHVADTFAAKLTPLRVPAPGEVGDLSDLARRVLVLASVGVVRRHRAAIGKDLPVEAFAAELAEVTTLLGTLEPDDPVGVASAWRLAAIRFDPVLHAGAGDLVALVDDLLEHVERGLALRDAGVLDRGIVADLLAASCLQLNAASRMSPDLAPRLDAEIRRLWTAFAHTLEIDFTELDSTQHAGIGYLVHNYAGFLGSPGKSADDLRTSLGLFDDFVIPFRKALYERIGATVVYGRAMYLAARTAVRLAELDRATGRDDEARELTATAVERVTWVLDQPEFQALLDEDEPSPDAVPLALNVAPCLLLAVELGIHPEPRHAFAWLDRLVKACDAAFRSITSGSARKAGRFQELATIRERLAHVRQQQDQQPHPSLTQPANGPV